MNKYSGDKKYNIPVMGDTRRVLYKIRGELEEKKESRVTWDMVIKHLIKNYNG